jgi:hypothetical protein
VLGGYETEKNKKVKAYKLRGRAGLVRPNLLVLALHVLQGKGMVK